MSEQAARELNDFGKDRLPGMLELKANFLGTVATGDTILGEATPVHLGRSTQVWDASVTSEKTGKTIAIFRCTQLILW